ncbi:MAG TPA: DNA replication and repair protein RecF [Cyclobacteriaceae bacterium]|nr:DNA replication and repair protein RecF [Cyclobacteriaceae bacterium]
MHLKNIHLTQFKNFSSVQIALSPEINCFLGNNGSGKTNLLDAVHYLCLTKSAVNAIDLQNIMHGHSFFAIKGEFQKKAKSVEIKCIVEAGKKKQLINNGKAYDKMSEHVGELPVVLIGPDDTQLIKGGSEERRKFFDGMLAQLDRQYLENLIRYQHFWKQRNALIKKFAETDRVDTILLEPYNEELIHLSQAIARKRAEFLESYAPLLVRHYVEISGIQEDVRIRYETHCLEQNFPGRFRSSLKKDLFLKRTSLGTHKDDFVFDIAGYPLKRFGSQGQQKSFLIALKLAQFHTLKDQKQTVPILLLDDIFDKLDDQRIKNLVALVARKEFGQLFITDARPERSRTILRDINSNISFFEVAAGQIRIFSDDGYRGH